MGALSKFNAVCMRRLLAGAEGDLPNVAPPFDANFGRRYELTNVSGKRVSVRFDSHTNDRFCTHC
jgi:hypothetical protein